MSCKQLLEEELKHLQPDESLILKCRVDETGARLTQISVKEHCERLRKKADLESVCQGLVGNKGSFVYSLSQIPVSTDPLWLFSQLKDFQQNYQIIVCYRGISQSMIKSRIESARKLNAHLNDIGQVDTDISFEEASQVLRGLSRGDECVVEMSFVLVSDEKLPLDSHFFLLEKSPALPLLSVFGLRPRLHRSHFVRAVTASDLVLTSWILLKKGQPS